MTILLSGNNLNGMDCKDHNNLQSLNRSIIYSIEQLKALTLTQIAHLFYSHQKYGRDLCQKKMRKLLEVYYKGYLKKINLGSNQDNIYYCGTKPPTEQLEHLIYTNWVYVRNILRLRLNPDIEVFHFEHVKDYGILKHDGFIGFRNVKENLYSFSFIEVDLSHNLFDKVKKYNTLKEDQVKWIHTWWAKLIRYKNGDTIEQAFPSIRVITNRKQRVLDCIKEENRGDLDFKVYTLGDMDGKLNKPKKKVKRSK